MLETCWCSEKLWQIVKPKMPMLYAYAHPFAHFNAHPVNYFGVILYAHLFILISILLLISTSTVNLLQSKSILTNSTQSISSSRCLPRPDVLEKRGSSRSIARLLEVPSTSPCTDCVPSTREPSQLAWTVYVEPPEHHPINTKHPIFITNFWFKLFYQVQKIIQLFNQIRFLLILIKCLFYYTGTSL